MIENTPPQHTDTTSYVSDTWASLGSQVGLLTYNLGNFSVPGGLSQNAYCLWMSLQRQAKSIGFSSLRRTRERLYPRPSPRA
jgi:hypothetical protein